MTDQVSRTLHKPVMLIRPQNGPPRAPEGRLINHILVTLDGSELSKLALSVSEELAFKLKVSATLFQMANRIILYGDWTVGNADIYYENRNEDEKKRVNDEMTKIETELKQRGLNVTHIVTAGFDAGDEIIDLSKKISADLVIMSSHGRSGLGRWWLGSVAEKVLRYGETPLLLVHAKTG